MSDKLCIIIDDKDQQRVFDSDVVVPLKREGYYVDGILINTTDPEILDDENNIDMDKLKAKIEEAMNGKSIDIIATDFDLSDEKINGIQVIEVIRKIRAGVPVLLYSGKLEEVIQSILGEYKTKNADELIKGIRKLMKYNIVDYVERTDYPATIRKLLKDKKIQLSALLLQKIREHSDMEFKSCYKPFAGKKLKDIANDSGVSVSSVSMILNKREGVSFSNETVEKVLSSAKKLGYEISSSQKKNGTPAYNTQRSAKYIAIFCPNISNSYYSTIAQSIEQAAYQKGFKTLIITTFRDEALEKEFLQDMINLHVSGIVFTMMPQCPPFLEKIAKKYPVIVIGDKTTDIDLNVIETSNYTAGVLMAEHLYELGHRNIAFLTTTIGKSLSLAMRYQRLKAIQNTYKKLCMNEPYNIVVKEAKIDPELERKNIFLEHGVGYQLCNECLDDRNLANLTAFIGNNDMVSYGIMDAILKKGYQIPDDFSVCGFDNDFASSLLPISLTTVEHYMEDKGKKAFDMIYEKIQEKDDFFVQDDKCVIRIEYKSKLISRDSTNVARTRKNINL